MATIFTNDFYLRFVRPSADERRVLTVGRATTVALSCWAMFFALQLSQYEAGIYTIFQTLIAFFNGPAFAVLLTGLLCLNLLVQPRQQRYAGLGLIVIAVGVPVYYAWRRWAARSS